MVSDFMTQKAHLSHLMDDSSALPLAFHFRRRKTQTQPYCIVDLRRFTLSTKAVCRLAEMNHALMKVQQAVRMEENVDHVLAMLDQEDTGYLYSHYLPRRADGSPDERVNVVWREKICQWSYNVVDHFDLSREVVAVSLSLFDRYLATLGNRCNGNLALLTSLTTMHIAIKLHETKKIKLGTLANLSRGQFGPADIEHLEWTILKALQWKLHPPTQYAFVSYLLLLLPSEVQTSPVRQHLHDVSMYLTELAVCDSYFVDAPSSTVAFAAILIVMEDTNLSKLPGGLRGKFLSTLTSKIGLNPNARDVVDARYRLRKTFASTNMSLSTLYSPHQQQQQHPQKSKYSHATNCDDDSYSSDDHSIASSKGSLLQRQQQAHHNSMSFHSSRTSCSSSHDSKGSYHRYSSAVPRRSFVASVSPVSCTSRAAISSSPIVAGTH